MDIYYKIISHYSQINRESLQCQVNKKKKEHLHRKKLKNKFIALLLYNHNTMKIKTTFNTYND